MIFNVGAGGTTDADKIKYGDSNVGATLDELQEDVSELNERLVNENGEEFRYGYQDGKRGVWVKEADTDVFVPFRPNLSSKLVEFLNNSEFRFLLPSIDNYKAQYNFVDLLSSPVTNGDFTLINGILDYEYIILYCMYKRQASSNYNCVEILNSRAIIYDKVYASNLYDKNEEYRKYVKFIDETNVNVTSHEDNYNSALRILGVK